jgi:hypothetical protein
VETRISATDFPDGCPLVDRGIVPDHNHWPPKMPKQMLQKAADLQMLDVFLVQHVIQPAGETLRTNGKSGDGRNPITFLMVTNNGCLPPWSPRLSHGRDQKESRFIDECDMGTQPHSVFFTRGQWVRFHSSTDCSSR